jgi:hypothetical protein
MRLVLKEGNLSSDLHPAQKNSTKTIIRGTNSGMEARGLESLDPMEREGVWLRESYLIQRGRTVKPNPRKEFLAVVGWGIVGGIGEYDDGKPPTVPT